MTETNGSFSSVFERKRVEGTRRVSGRYRGMRPGPRAPGEARFSVTCSPATPLGYISGNSAPVLIPRRLNIQVSVERTKT